MIRTQWIKHENIVWLWCWYGTLIRERHLGSQGILGAFEPWFIVYRYSSSLLLASSFCAAEAWLTIAFWLRCCWWCSLEVDLVRHIFAKWFGFPHFRQVLLLARHGLALCGHASPHWRHVFEHVCWGQVVGYKEKVSADYFFLQEILADIITYTSQSTCSGLGQIIFIHLISRFWSGGRIVRSFHNCIYIIL